MSVDIATLGLEIKSDGVTTASQRLNKMVKDGAEAENATKRLDVTWRQFTAERMSEYMRTEGGHAGAMKRMSAEWAEYKKNATAAATSVVATTEKISQSTNGATAATSKLSVSTAELTRLANLAASAFAAWKLYELVKSSIDAQLQIDRLNKLFFAAAGSANLAAKELEYVRATSERMGLDVVTTAESYGKFMASIRGTSLEGQKGRQVFESVSGAATTLGLRADETAGIFNAMQQMMSKGSVQAEELRGQLGERLPGAFKMAADAMGMTTGELSKQMALGNVMADDLLPKLAVELDKAYGKAATEGAKSAQAAINRFNNSVLETKATLGSALIPVFTDVLNAIRPALELLKEFVGGIEILAVKAASIPDKLAAAWDNVKSGRGMFSKEGLEAYAAAKQTITANEDAAIAEILKKFTLSGSDYTAGEGIGKGGKSSSTSQAAAAVEKWRATYADLRKEIAALNPTLTEQEKAVLAVANKYEDLAHKKGANIALLQQLKAEHVKAITDHYAMADAIKATSDEFREYLRLAESEPPQNNETGEMNLRWADELELLKSLQPSAGIDALNDQIAMFERLLSDIPSKSEEVAAAIAKLKSDFAASSGLDAMRKGNTEISTSLISNAYDPNSQFEEEKKRIQDRYDYERDLQEKALKRAEKDADLKAAIEKRLSLLKQEYIKNTAEVDYKARAAMLANTASYTGMAGELFAALATTQDETSRQGFESAKAFNTAAAVMNTAAAIMNALATVPYPMSLAAAALAGATGAIQIAKIQSTTFGGGGGVASVSGGSFAGGGGAGTSGASVGPQIHSVQDTQTEDSLRALATASDNASLAIGRVADGLTSIADLFETGYSKNMGAGLSSAGYNQPVGAFGQIMSETKSIIKGSLAGAFWDFGSVAKSIGDTLIAPFTAIKDAFFGGSWYTSGAGISLGMQGGAFSGRAYTERTKDGGWFSSDKHRTNYSTLDAGAQEVFDDYIAQIKSAIARAAVSTGTTTNFSAAQVSAMNISTAGRSAEDIEKDLANFFNIAANELAKTTSGLEEFSFYGENAFDALVRMSTSLQGVNENLALIGHTLIDSTLKGADLAYRLADAFGGLDKMNDATDNYLSAMFSDHEQEAMRAAAAQREVNVAFAEMGRTVPQTREEFRALVNSLDLNSDSATYVSLMNIAEAFGTVQEAADNAARDMLDSQRDLQSRWLHATADGDADLYDLRIQQEQEIQDYIAKGLNTTRLLEVQAREYTNALSATFKTPLLEAATSAANAIKSILGGNLSTLSPEEQYKAQQEAFANALANGQTAQLGALGQSLLASSKSYYGSSASYAADYDMVMRALANVAGISDPSFEAAQKQIDLLQQISDNTTLYVTATTTLAQLMSQQLGLPVGVPRFANGGITSGPSIAGEGRYREAVVPLPDGRTIQARVIDGNEALIAEVKALREEVVELRKQSVGKLTDIEAPLRRVAARG